MDQLRLSAISPKKMRTKAKMKALLQVKIEIHRNMDEITNPMPQIKGSDRAALGLSLTLKILPKGTPTTPDNMVMTPKIKGILKKGERLSLSLSNCQ